MPREQINIPARRIVSTPTATNGLNPGEYGTRWAQDGDALSEGEHWEESPMLSVGWHRPTDHGLPSDEGCLQFHMAVDADEVLRAAAEIARCRENPEVPGYPQWTFSTVNLSRQEAQKAILSTRRARDAAYGKDA